MLHRFANPARFSRLAKAVLPWLATGTVILFAVALYYALFASPPDYQQGDTVRIMYVHVPAATLAMGCFAFIAVMSAVSLIWKHPLADIAARSAAPLGAGFTIIVLATGSLWGKPTWGTWWVWDARLTSVLVLLFFYLGHIALTHAFDNPARGAKAAAILALVGFVDLPIIKFSVDWWNTLHQPASLIRIDGPTIDPTILTPLLLMGLAFSLYFVTFLLIRMRADLAAQRARALRLNASNQRTECDSF